MRNNFTLTQQNDMRKRSNDVCEAGKDGTEAFYGMAPGERCQRMAQEFDGDIILDVPISYSLWWRKCWGYVFMLFTGLPPPEQCPPEDAQPFPDGTIVYRLVSKENPDLDDFLQSRLDPTKTRPKKCSECRWAAMSVWSGETPLESLTDLLKYDKLSHLKYIVKLEVNQDSGVSLLWDGHDLHYSFWMSTTFDPIASIKKVIPHG